MNKYYPGFAREMVDMTEAALLLKRKTLVVDSRRRRPHYFDGRFLAAKDLIREQKYFLTRQADLGRAMGSGVVRGLMVGAGATGSSIMIQSGHGVTPGGESVVLSKNMTIDVADVVDIQNLDRAFGLHRIPRTPSRNLTGLFILAIRPVEYTANPIASYPTTITGKRTIEDGDVVEAAAITLFPYTGGDDGPDMGRAAAAREIFVEGRDPGAPDGLLPLAMVALNRGVVQWIDPFMVRREVGAEHGDVLGLGFAPRASREAHLLQYDQHLDQIMEMRGGAKFAASDYFQALPPAGRAPVSAIDPKTFSQIYFPPEIDVELSVIPEDETPVMLEESLLLPPIDLTLDGEALESTSIVMMVPVGRNKMPYWREVLKGSTRSLQKAAPGLVAKRKPIEALRLLKFPMITSPTVSLADTVDSHWRCLLSRLKTGALFYARRRDLMYKDLPEALNVEYTLSESNECPMEDVLSSMIEKIEMSARFIKLKKKATMAAISELFHLLISDNLKNSNLLMAGAIFEMNTNERLNRAEVLRMSNRYSGFGFGEGILALERVNENLTKTNKVIKALARSGKIPEIDKLGRLIGKNELPGLANELVRLGKPNNRKLISKFVEKKLKELEK